MACPVTSHQSSSSSSLARSRPVLESIASLPGWPFFTALTPKYWPSRVICTFDHPSSCNFDRTCSSVTARSPAMKTGPCRCSAVAAHFSPAAPVSIETLIAHTAIVRTLSRFMIVSLFDVFEIAAEHSPFKAILKPAQLNSTRRKNLALLLVPMERHMLQRRLTTHAADDLFLRMGAGDPPTRRHAQESRPVFQQGRSMSTVIHVSSNHHSPPGHAAARVSWPLLGAAIAAALALAPTDRNLPLDDGPGCTTLSDLRRRL